MICLADLTLLLPCGSAVAFCNVFSWLFVDVLIVCAATSSNMSGSSDKSPMQSPGARMVGSSPLDPAREWTQRIADAMGVPLETFTGTPESRSRKVCYSTLSSAGALLSSAVALCSHLITPNSITANAELVSHPMAVAGHRHDPLLLRANPLWDHAANASNVMFRADSQFSRILRVSSLLRRCP